MTLDARDREVLDLDFPEEEAKDDSYILSLRTLLETPEFIKELEDQQNRERPPQVEEAKRQVKRAIDAASGLQKVIEQVHSKNANVTIGGHEKDVRRAIKRVFGSSSDKITFQMYKQAIEKLRDISTTIKDAVIDEQARGI